MMPTIPPTTDTLPCFPAPVARPRDLMAAASSRTSVRSGQKKIIKRCEAVHKRVSHCGIFRQPRSFRLLQPDGDFA